MDKKAEKKDKKAEKEKKADKMDKKAAKMEKKAEKKERRKRPRRSKGRDVAPASRPRASCRWFFSAGAAAVRPCGLDSRLLR